MTAKRRAAPFNLAKVKIVTVKVVATSCKRKRPRPHMLKALHAARHQRTER